MTLLNIGIVFHMIIGCFMLTNSTIFEMKKVQIDSSLDDFQDDINLGEGTWLSKRAQYPHQIVYIIFVIVTLVSFYGGKKLEDFAKTLWSIIK